MSSDNFLVAHAYKHVWCGPGQDRQYILRPTRLSLPSGALHVITIGLSRYTLPEPGVRYDVFAFGDLHPEDVGMDRTQNTWITAQAHCNARKLLIHLYNQAGVHYPLSKAWLLRTRNGNLVLALARIGRGLDYGQQDIYVRWRRAAFFSRPSEVGNLGVEVNYHQFSGNNGAFATFRNRWLAAKGRLYGQAIALINGRRSRELVAAGLTQGDHLEYIWDGDVKEVLEFNYRGLRSFDSVLDGSVKYLLPRPGLGDGIDFIDDTDFYVLNYSAPARYDGVYYHQNQSDAIRMVTHRDYAIRSLYLNSLMEAQAWSILDDVRIEVIVRHSGYDRALVDEFHRIKELFKLDEPSRIDAMIGPDSQVDVWKAPALENSTYLKLMSERFGNITPDAVMDAYGYHAVSRLTGLVPMKRPDQRPWVDLQYGQYVRSTVYEYGEDGQLLGWYRNAQQLQYSVRNPQCRYIEAFAGHGGEGLSTLYDTHLDPEPITLDPHRDYRFYLGSISTTGAIGNWQDITGNTSYYQVINNQVIWGVLSPTAITAIRNDLDFLSKTIELDARDGVLIFTIGTEEVYPGPADVYLPMDIPPGEYDIFLNGWDMVEGIDFFKKWPEFCIVNKRHRDPGDLQTVTIRARGFCKPDLSFDQPGESGFVVKNQLSRNARYNVRDDLVTRVSMGGALYTLDELAFAEDDTFMDPVANGTPYRITHPVVPMGDLIEGDTYAYRALSLAVDHAVEDYLTEYRPEPDIPGPNAIDGAYPVISPFIGKIIDDVLDGFITMDDFMGNYSDQDVANRLSGYTYLLEYEPALNVEGVDYFQFLPHRYDQVDLTIFEFQFIDRAIRVFLNNMIELSRYARIVEQRS